MNETPSPQQAFEANIAALDTQLAAAASERAELEAQLTATTAKYDEAVQRAAADPLARKDLPPLRQRRDAIAGTLEDLKAVVAAIERAKGDAKAEEAARLAAEKWAADVRSALEHVAKYEAAGDELWRAVEALGSAYKSFNEVSSTTNAALYHVSLSGHIVQSIDADLAKHLIVTAELRHLPGLDEHPRFNTWPRPINERVRVNCKWLREKLASTERAEPAEAEEELT